MQGKEKERLIVTLHYTFLFKRSIFLFVRRGDGKQSWYPGILCEGKEGTLKASHTSVFLSLVS